MSIEKLTSVLEDWKRNSDPLALHPDRLLRIPEVCLLANLPSARAVHHAIKNIPGFPPGSKWRKNRVWKLSEILEYIALVHAGGGNDD
jgi:predicted DNA-binding transcriptional regulator AlpA